MKRSEKKLPAERVRDLKREGDRIDREEAARIKRQGRAIKAQYDHLREIARALKAERLRLGLSLADLAERTGIDRGNLSRLENDPQSNPTVETLLRYADALGCEVRIHLEPGSSPAA
jgi:DNA-binding Xre family transcriptional regulator